MWAGLRRTSDYEPWYRAFYTAAKSVDPRLEVGVGTLSGWDFVSKLSPDLPMDAVSMHPYAGDDWGLDTSGIERLHDGLLARGVNVPIWVTEYGWGQWMDPAHRARSLSKVFAWMQARSYIQLADYHMLQDAEEADECCWGLVGPAPSFAPREPAYSFFSSIAVSGWKRLQRAHPVRTPAPAVARLAPAEDIPRRAEPAAKPATVPATGPATKPADDATPQPAVVPAW